MVTVFSWKLFVTKIFYVHLIHWPNVATFFLRGYSWCIRVNLQWIFRRACWTPTLSGVTNIRIFENFIYILSVWDRYVKKSGIEQFVVCGAPIISMQNTTHIMILCHRPSGISSSNPETPSWSNKNNEEEIRQRPESTTCNMEDYIQEEGMTVV